MKHDYARTKLECLLRDLNNYTSDEFRREMMRIASGATGEDIPDDAHIIKAERDALVAQNKELLCYAADAERWFNKHDPNGYVSPRREKAQQHLAEIRAEAGRAGYMRRGLDEAHILSATYGGEWDAVNRFADTYADRIRQGGDV